MPITYNRTITLNLPPGTVFDRQRAAQGANATSIYILNVNYNADSPQTSEMHLTVFDRAGTQLHDIDVSALLSVGAEAGKVLVRSMFATNDRIWIQGANRKDFHSYTLTGTTLTENPTEMVTLVPTIPFLFLPLSFVIVNGEIITLYRRGGHGSNPDWKLGRFDSSGTQVSEVSMRPETDRPGSIFHVLGGYYVQNRPLSPLDSDEPNIEQDSAIYVYDSTFAFLELITELESPQAHWLTGDADELIVFTDLRGATTEFPVDIYDASVFVVIPRFTPIPDTTNVLEISLPWSNPRLGAGIWNVFWTDANPMPEPYTITLEDVTGETAVADMLRVVLNNSDDTADGRNVRIGFGAAFGIGTGFPTGETYKVNVKVENIYGRSFVQELTLNLEEQPESGTLFFEDDAIRWHLPQLIFDSFRTSSPSYRFISSERSNHVRALPLRTQVFPSTHATTDELFLTDDFSFNLAVLAGQDLATGQHFINPQVRNFGIWLTNSTGAIARIGASIGIGTLPDNPGDPPTFGIDQVLFRIPSGEATQGLIGQVSAAGTGRLTYSIDTTIGEVLLIWGINESNGKIFIVENSQSAAGTGLIDGLYHTSVTVRDTWFRQAVLTIRVQVGESDTIQANAPVFPLNTINFNVANAPANGALVGVITASGDAALTYAISGSDAASFAINTTTGRITVAIPNLAAGDFTFQITATDSNALTGIATVNVNVLESTETLPDVDPPNFGNARQSYTLDASPADDTIVGTIAATSALALAYTLGGADAAHFDIDATTGQITTEGVLDSRTYTFSVIATDSDDTLSTFQIVVIVLSGAEVEIQRPVFGRNAISVEIPNNPAPGTVVTVVTATSQSPLTYSLSSGDTQSFEIDAISGRVTTIGSVGTGFFALTVTATDANGVFASIALNISVGIEQTSDLTPIPEVPVGVEKQMYSTSGACAVI